MTWPTTRRAVIGGALAGALARPTLARRSPPRAVVVGGGFGGITAARALARGGAAVTLVEPRDAYVACPASNEIVAGLRALGANTFDYEGVRHGGLTHVRAAAEVVDGAARQVRLVDGTRLPFDRVVLSPGIEMRLDALSGYDGTALERMPHAWQAGPQTQRLARQLEALRDGEAVLLTVPASPYRCPPGPYERASLIAHFLKARKPRSKLIVLDAKDTFSKQPLFEAAWKALYPDHLEYVPLSAGGRVTAVDPARMRVRAEGGLFTGGVVNVIPPQRAPKIARVSGLTDAGGWCPVDPVTFESRLVPGVHVVGDAAAAGAMPKSAFAANAQAKVCAQAVLDLLEGRKPTASKLINVCYSLVEPDRAISIAGVFHVVDGTLASIPAASGISPLDAPDAVRRQEAAYMRAWYDTITRAVFG